MKLPTVGQCCCCVNLITGGKIIGWLGIVHGILSLIGSFERHEIFFHAIASLAIFACWLYGIENSRPSYLLLNVVLSSISLVFVYIADVIFLCVVVYAAASEKPIEIEGVPLTGMVILMVFMVILICLTPLTTYFWVVTYSVYKAVQELSQESPYIVYPGSGGVSQDAFKNSA